MRVFYLILILFSNPTLALAQENYPIPKETPTRLFYIQHSNNYNTYVYDANMYKDSIDTKDPIKSYRILYADQGEIKPLTSLQKRMAYGYTATYIKPNFFKIYLEANKNIPLYLTLNSSLKPIIYTTINHRKMIIDSVFLKLKDNFPSLKIELEYILFKGKDFHSKKAVTETYSLAD